MAYKSPEQLIAALPLIPEEQQFFNQTQTNHKILENLLKLIRCTQVDPITKAERDIHDYLVARERRESRAREDIMSPF